MSGRPAENGNFDVVEVCNDAPSTSAMATSHMVTSPSLTQQLNAGSMTMATARFSGESRGGIGVMVDDSDETALLARHYNICDIIEKGPIYTLYRATSRTSRHGQHFHKAFTIKSLDLRRYLSASGLTQDDVEQEVEICASLKHSYFCELKDVIYGSKALHMVFEYVEGSDICFEIVKRVSLGFIYSEAVASHYTRQLMEALRYLHAQNIIHRDIRPHNILLANKENNAPLKIRGFGVAHRLDSLTSKCLPGRIGISHFMAPEIVSEKEYGTQADIWSAGVVLYILLFGRLPFIGTLENVYENIRKGSYLKNTGDLWTQTISESAKDLLSKLLCVDENQRLTAEQALQHPWLADRSLPGRVHLNETVDNIRKYNLRRKLKSNIVATANNARWNRFPVNSFLSADSVPGGDTCDFECTRRRSELLTTRPLPAADMMGVQMILSSLDKAIVIADCSMSTPKVAVDPESESLLQGALDDKNLHEMLFLYDRIRTHGIRPSPVNRNAEQCLSEAREEAERICELESENAELAELTTLLRNAHLQGVLQAHDVVIEEVFASVALTKFSSFTSPSGELSSLSLEEGRKRPDSTISTEVIKSTVPLSNGSLRNLSTISPDIIGRQDAEGIIEKGLEAHTSGILKSRSVPPADCSTHQHPCASTAVSAIEDDDRPITLFYDNDNDDLLLNAVSRVRLVQFQKDTEEPMGITLKITEDGRCFIARIMHGGMIHRQSTLHVGDEIREINGVSVANQSAESLQRILRDMRGQIQFKIVPSYRSAPPACEIYIRAQYDYDPTQDDLIPCAQAGVPFRTGDILQVISKDDHNWWQARFVAPFPAIGNAGAHSNRASHHYTSEQSGLSSLCSTKSHNISATKDIIAGATTTNPPLPPPIAANLVASSAPTPATVVAGLIPSPELQEWRTACMAMERAKDTSTCMWFNKKKKYYTTKYLKKHSELFEQLDLVTYEEVIRLSSFRRKTLVLLGAHGVGRRHIKNTLIHRHPQRFAYPQPHTTRPMRKDEIDGKHYFFVSNDIMLADIQANEYLEYGTHEESMYGTKLETIRSIHRTGKMAILDVEPQALKVLRTAEYAPFVVFIAAPDLHGLQDPDGSLERLVKESEMLKQAFGHLFDYIIINNDVDETIRHLEVIVEKLNVIPQWVPVSWVY